MSPGPTRFRERSALHTPVYLGQTSMSTNGGVTWGTPTQLWYNCSGRTYSYLDSCLDRTNPGPPYRSGGPLGVYHYSDPISLRSVGTYIQPYTGLFWYRYQGGFVIDAQPGSAPIPYTSVGTEGRPTGEETIGSLGDISAYGATGWNRFRPGNPTADLGVFLGELRDVPRMLSGTAKFFHDLWRSMGGHSRSFGPKSVADAWLNTQFGWLPFLSDLRKFYKTFTDLSTILDRIRRNNGRWVKRGGFVSDGGTETTVGSSSNTTTLIRPALASVFYVTPSAPGSYTRRAFTTRRVWFEGRFKYWIPDIGTPEWERRAVIDLFGALPNPSLLWELTPWSWLVDWCSNVGDVIANMDTGYAENLAAQYAFVMGTTELRGEADSSARFKFGTISDNAGYTVVYKHRVPASPFGFGLTGADFSIRQWSILSALGLSRANYR